MKYFRYLFLLAIILLPGAVFAAGLVPDCEGSSCNFGYLIQLANNIIKFLILTGTSVFAIMFMYAGYTYLTANGNTSQVEKGHTLLLDSIIGFVIMLAAWLLVDFILTALIDSGKVGNYRILK